MSVAVVIVNYRTPELVKACLDTIAREPEAAAGLRVFVGDAASGDGSTATIARHIADRGYAFATCYDIGANGGFAYGNNHILTTRVLTDPTFDHVHFLNPDTELRPGAIGALVAALRARPDAGVVGSRLEDPDGSPQAFGFRFPTPWREFFRGARLPVSPRALRSTDIAVLDLDTTREVDWVSGASFMMPRAVIERVGLMDPGYFLYYEEVDLMSRVRRAGYSIWAVCESRVVHLGGQATGRRGGERPTRLPPYWYRSRFKFFRDRNGMAGAIAANLLFLLGDIVFRVHRRLRGRTIADPPFLWRDMLVHGFSLPPDDGGGR